MNASPIAAPNIGAAITRSMTWLAEREHANRVGCPESPYGCGAAPGADCRTSTGSELRAPAHAARLGLADQRFGQADAPTSAPAPRHLTAVADDLMTVPRQSCRWCQRKIIVAATEDGDVWYVDSEPAETGRCLVSLRPGRGGRLLVRVGGLTTGQAAGARERGVVLRSRHRDTCPRRERWVGRFTRNRVTRR